MTRKHADAALLLAVIAAALAIWSGASVWFQENGYLHRHPASAVAELQRTLGGGLAWLGAAVLAIAVVLWWAISHGDDRD